MKFQDGLLIFVGILIVIGGLSLFIFMIDSLLELSKEEKMMEDFCEERGYELTKGINRECYKVQNDKLITKSIRVIDKEVYFEE